MSNYLTVSRLTRRHIRTHPPTRAAPGKTAAKATKSNILSAFIAAMYTTTIPHGIISCEL